MLKRFACIYIESEKIELITAQRGANKKVQFIDRAYYPIQVGFEIYQKDFISNKSVKLIERVAQEYLRMARENLPEEIEIIFSKEISKADNFIFLYSSIQSFAQDAKLIILTKEEELDLFCTTSKLLISEEYDISKTNIMMASINVDRIDFSLTNNGIVDFTERIPYGYLKLSELVETITRQRTHYSKLLSEIIESKLRLAIEHIGKRQLKYVSLISRDAEAIAQNFEHEDKGNLYIFSKDNINNAYRTIKELTPEQIQDLYPTLTETQSLTLQSTIIVARQLINTAKTDEIILVQKNVAESIVKLKFQLTKQKEITAWLNEGSYESSLAISQRYNVDQEHAEMIERFAVQFFNALKKRYNLTKDEKRFLQISSRLLDIGQFGGEEGQARACEEIILREDIIGLTKDERRLVARICFNAKTNDYAQTRRTNEFTLQESLIIAHLTAILKLVTTLDQSRKKKVSKLAFSISDNILTVKITTSHNTQLENYYFNRDSKWVERVFELKPVLKVKRVKV